MPTIDDLLSERQSSSGQHRAASPRNDIRESIELCCLGIAIFLALGLFALPIVFHHIEITDQNVLPTPATPEPTPNNSDLCLQSRPPIDNTSCPSYSWGRMPAAGGRCTAAPYTSSVCILHLDNWQQCSLGLAGSVRVDDTVDLIAAERNATTFINLLNLAASPQCQVVAIPFICQYLFPLCDCSGENTLLPSKQDCIRISTDDCREEWIQVQRFGFGSMLPDCSRLPVSSSTQDNSGDGDSIDTGSNHTNSSERICRENFDRVNGTCQPICHLWEQTPRPWSVVLKSINIISLSVGLISGVVVTILAFIQHKKILRFPSISLVYINMGVCVIAITGLVGESATEHLYCSSLSLLASINEPTVYCNIAGAILHYFLVNLTLWWLTHTYFLFHVTVWPTHRRTIERRQRWIHLAVFIVVTAVPLAGVLLVILSENFQYSIFNFPPMFCVPNSSVFFYSATMVLDIAVAEGIILLLIATTVTYKHQGLFRTRKGGQILIHSSEKRLLVVLGYNALFIVAVTVFSSLAGSNVSQRFTQALTEHFTCEALGHTPGRCDRAVSDQYNTAWVFTVILVLLSLIPAVSLVHIWNTRRLKQLRCCSRNHT